jgi:hypothetical protein
MSLRSRPMQPRDVRECAEIVVAHPAIGPRYHRSIKDLSEAWLRLLDCEAKTALLVEELNGSKATICFVGVSIFASDDFVREIKTPPLFWVGPELARRMIRGNSPVLSSREFREANTRGGLTTVTWEACIRAGYETHIELHRKILGVFIENHRGYLWKEAIASQLESVERLQWTVQTGGLVWDPAKGGYVKTLKRDLQHFVREPHIVGVSRDVEHGRPGSWVGALFDYHPPCLGFSPREQRLLQSALEGERGTDQELAGALGVSVPTVKKMWLSLYRRVAENQPEIIPASLRPETGTSERGKEKRRRLLAYLREHPEELRPVSRNHVSPD